MATFARVNLFLASLTEEEKELMEAEGVVLPSSGPITRIQERELKQLRRKIKNKLSAQDSRRKRKEYVGQIEDENELLKEKVGFVLAWRRVLSMLRSFSLAQY